MPQKQSHRDLPSDATVAKHRFFAGFKKKTSGNYTFLAGLQKFSKPMGVIEKNYKYQYKPFQVDQRYGHSCRISYQGLKRTSSKVENFNRNPKCLLNIN